MTRRVALGLLIGLMLAAGALAIVLGGRGAHAAAGTLDPSFGPTGEVFTGFDPAGTLYLSTAAVAVEPDGKVVAVGAVGPTGGSGFTVARYTTSGHLERLVKSRNAATEAVAIQPDGKVVVAIADSVSHGYGLGFHLARYTASGALDPSFGAHGMVQTPFGPRSGVLSIRIAPDGKVVLAVQVDVPSGGFALARYTASGKLDPSFGTGGEVQTAVPPRAFAIEPDGKIVVAGNTRSGSALARYTASGALDPSFGAHGEVPMNFDSPFGLDAVGVEPDGKIVVAGDRNYNFTLARYAVNGTTDPSFGTRGEAVTHIQSWNVQTVAIEPDGKIVAAGSSFCCDRYEFGLVRFTTSGTFDTSFGTHGRVLTRVPGNNGAYAAAIQPDGRIVMLGFCASGFNTSGFELARYLP